MSLAMPAAGHCGYEFAQFAKQITFPTYIISGCSAARLARYVRDVEVVSSNLTTPTKIETNKTVN